MACWNLGGPGMAYGLERLATPSLIFGLMLMATLTTAKIVVTQVCLFANISETFLIHCSGNITMIIKDYAKYNALFRYIVSNN